MQTGLVVGGSGFLGTALANALLERGLQVRSFDLNPHPNPQIESLTGDIRNPAQVLNACEGVDVVFQTASLIDWGPRSRERLEAINIQGNQNVIRACQKLGVQRLVYTSSIDVVFEGKPIRAGDESLPYPPRGRFLDDYGRTKAQAEQDVLHANGQEGLLTCCLRTAGIYGPGDRHRFPAVMRAVQQGQFLSMGDGSARFSHVYLGNVVEAHIQAAYALQPASPVCGQAYFITDHPPQNFYAFFAPYLKALGYPIPSRSLPAWAATALGSLLEGLALLGIGPQPPLLTRYVVASTCLDFYFSYAKAARDFGYQPVVSEEQAMRQTIAWLRQAGFTASQVN